MELNPGHVVGKSNQAETISPQIHESLVEAVKTGNISTVLDTNQRYNIQLRDIVDNAKFKGNLLWVATVIRDEDRCIAMMTFLLKYGVDPLYRDSLKQTPLYYSSRDGLNKVCQFLIDQGVDVNNIDTYGQNPIFYAVSNGHLDTCKLLKENGSNHDIADEMQQSPLFYAVKQNREHILRWLLNLGSNVKIVDKKGLSILNFAKRSGKHHFKEILEEYGAPKPNDTKIAKIPKKPVAPVTK